MSSEQERRVVEALQTLSGGLLVTEQDILLGTNRLKDRFEPPSPRRRLSVAVVLAAAAIVVSLVVLQVTDDDERSSPLVTDRDNTPAGELIAALDPRAYAGSDEELDSLPAPTLDGLAGLWLLRPYVGITGPMIVTRDGSYGFAPGDPFETATLEGDQWVRKNSSEGCPPTQTYTTGVAADESLRLQVNRSENTCTPTDGREAWDPIAPGTAVPDYWLAVSDEVAWEPSRPSERLEGLYVAPATGHLLEVDPDGRYRFYSELKVDELTPADEGELVLEPGILAASCVGGTFSGPLEIARMPGVGHLVAGTTALRFVADKDQCTSSIAANDLWVRLVVNL